MQRWRRRSRTCCSAPPVPCSPSSQVPSFSPVAGTSGLHCVTSNLLSAPIPIGRCRCLLGCLHQHMLTDLHRKAFTSADDGRLLEQPPFLRTGAATQPRNFFSTSPDTSPESSPLRRPLAAAAAHANATAAGDVADMEAEGADRKGHEECHLEAGCLSPTSVPGGWAAMSDGDSSSAGSEGQWSLTGGLYCTRFCARNLLVYMACLVDLRRDSHAARQCRPTCMPKCCSLRQLKQHPARAAQALAMRR